MTNYKSEYRQAAGIVYAAASLMDRAMPAGSDDEAWKKWEAARGALYSYASYLQSHPFNPVLQEAHVRGDYADFLEQLERGNEENRKRHGWTKKQVKKAIPIIRKLAEEEKSRD